jgi:hypothetical protein
MRWRAFGQPGICNQYLNDTFLERSRPRKGSEPIMTVSLALLLGLAAATPRQVPHNLDFADGKLTGWEGQGFYITTGTTRGPSLTWGVCSSDCGPQGRTGLLYRTFIVPPGAGAIRFSAAVEHQSGTGTDSSLNVSLEAAGGRFIQRQVHTSQGWEPAPALLPRQRGQPREYLWPVSDLVGQTVRIALTDADARPGNHVWCGGFHFVSADELNGKEFARFMVRLTREMDLAPMERVDSRHFLAIGNAAAEYTQQRLYNCETIYPLFLDHFRRKGFRLSEPGAKLMVAVFDSQAGFEAYLGQRMSAATTGVYHGASNRLVVYDYARNRSFTAAKQRGQELGRQLANNLQRQHYLGSLSQQAQVRRADANIGTIMHEVAHQLSFNCGLLNRDGDVPLWLAEGLACYCEATDNGSWQGVGEANPMRANRLAGPASGQEPFLPLRALVTSEDWLRKATAVDQVLLGYSQSWALFSVLMQERPRALRKYLGEIYSRRTSDRRLSDFAEAFGPDLASLEARYQAFVREVVRQQVRTRP